MIVEGFYKRFSILVVILMHYHIIAFDVREKHANLLRHELSPHVYATSASAYLGLRDNHRDQR